MFKKIFEFVIAKKLIEKVLAKRAAKKNQPRV